MPAPIIEVDHVSKEFKLGQLRSLKQTSLDAFARIRGREVPEQTPFKALDDVAFEVAEGEVVGIIGQNGAGKSTLLKLLAGISKASKGRIVVRGKVAPLIEVGAGLVPDLTGRENILLNAIILGLRRAEIMKKFDEIVAFAELEEFIDTPIKRYSSGMQVRLGFSIATRTDADILIVDEVLAVGDIAFQRKCFDRMEDMIKRQGKTVLLVSHNIRQVERICSRVMLLEHGVAIADGNPSEVCNLFIDKSNQKIQAAQSTTSSTRLTISDEIAFRSIEILDGEDAPCEAIEFMSPMRVRLTFEAKVPMREITFYIGLHTSDFIYLTANNTVDRPIDLERGIHSVVLDFDAMTLLPGVYCVLGWIGSIVGRTVFHGENLCTFRVYAKDYVVTRQRDRALFHMEGSWTLPETSEVTEGASRLVAAR